MTTELKAVTYGCEAVGYPDFSMFFNPESVQPAKVGSPVPPRHLRLHLSRDKTGLFNAEASPQLIDHIRKSSIYGHPDLVDLHRDHYLELVVQGDSVLVVLKFQTILGQRILGRVPKAALSSAGVL